ncbi:uncharacterized protein GlcG (DUF336 family) [Sphingobium xanthum]|uniref:heme-binding protein n=1 Tax=Sphingobium xanthum TaxID=1387165 RepID=UPI001C8C25F3|nr:heme-binding protein [Sphingobium xanthum]
MQFSTIAKTLLLSAIAAPVLAQPAPPPPRAKGPALEFAVEAAQIAIKTCLANGYKTTVQVSDSEGIPVALLSADGVGARTQAIVASKTAMVIKYKVSSGTIADRMKTDAKLDAEVKADPKMPFPWRGALPLMAGSEQIGAIAVSGAPGGEKDEACAEPAIKAIAGRLK